MRAMDPTAKIEISVRHGQQRLFTETGLADRVLLIGEDKAIEEGMQHVPWNEPNSSYADTPSTKVERFLREKGIAIDPAIAYHIDVPAADREWARSTLRSVAGAEPRKVALLQTKGASFTGRKDVDDGTAAKLADVLRAAGYQPVLWDGLHKSPRFTACPRLVKADLGQERISDAMRLAALIAECGLLVAIDSGPLHLAAAISHDAPPAIGLWTGNHPLHYMPPSSASGAPILHLVPRKHRELLLRPIPAGLDYFREHYQYHVYRDLPRALEYALRVQGSGFRIPRFAPLAPVLRPIILGRWGSGVRAGPLDLIVDEPRGLAYQRDRTRPIEYGRDYWTKYVAYAQTELGAALTRVRRDLVVKHLSGLDGKTIVDVGIGSGQFLQSLRPFAAEYAVQLLGTDANPLAEAWLRKEQLWTDTIPPDADAVTLWDVLEHFAEPAEFLASVPRGGHIFTCLPVFAHMERIKESKHYRPNEHFWYFTAAGLIRLFADQGFELLEHNDAESRMGRESIETFVFRKN